MLLCGCTTRIPYTGDLASVQMAIGHPGKTVNAPKDTGYHLPIFAPGTSTIIGYELIEDTGYIGEPIFAPGTSTQIGHRKIVRLPKFEGRTYHFWVEEANRSHLLYSIVHMEAFGFYEMKGTVDIRVDGTHAIISGGNDAVLDFLSLKLRIDHPRTATHQ